MSSRHGRTVRSTRPSAAAASSAPLPCSTSGERGYGPMTRERSNGSAPRSKIGARTPDRGNQDGTTSEVVGAAAHIMHKRALIPSLEIFGGSFLCQQWILRRTSAATTARTTCIPLLMRGETIALVLLDLPYRRIANAACKSFAFGRCP